MLRLMMLVLTLTWALVNWSDGEGAHSDLEAFLQPELPIITVCPEGPPTCQFTKIQDAINSAPEDFSHPSLIDPAAIIQVAPGVYEESLLILKSVILQGAGSDRVFLRPPKNDSRRDFSIFISGSHIIVYISGFTIQGAPIKIMGLAGWPVSGVAITKNRFEKSGIYIYGTDSPVYIERNAFLSPDQDYCPGIDASYVGWLRILKNTFDWRCKIDIEEASLLSAEKPRVLIAENMEAIVRISGSHDVVIRENTLKSIKVSDSEVVTIIGNVIHEGSGVVVYNSGGIVISANQIENNGNGIAIRYLSNGKEPSVQIVNNRIVRNERFGILTEKLEYVTICQGNEVRENKEGDYGVGVVFPQPSPELKAKCEGG